MLQSLKSICIWTLIWGHTSYVIFRLKDWFQYDTLSYQSRSFLYTAIGYGKDSILQSISEKFFKKKHQQYMLFCRVCFGFLVNTSMSLQFCLLIKNLWKWLRKVTEIHAVYIYFIIFSLLVLTVLCTAHAKYERIFWLFKKNKQYMKNNCFTIFTLNYYSLLLYWNPVV